MDYPVGDVRERSSMDDEWYQGASAGDTQSEEEDDRTMGDHDDVSGFNQQHPPCPWYYQQKYSRYWQHYAAMQSWMMTYTMMHRNQSMGYPHMMGNRYGAYPSSTSAPSTSPYWNPNSRRTPNQYETPAPHYHNNAPHYHTNASHYHNNVPRYHTNAHQSGTHYHDNERRLQEYSNDDDESDEGSMDIEMSQEMIDFFKKSQKFREERDRAKAEAEKEAKASKKKGKNPLNAEDKINCRAPVERPDEGRRRGMKILYGKHTARIHSMETAMQMQFDRNCDRFQPAYWPIVALKL